MNAIFDLLPKPYDWRPAPNTVGASAISSIQFPMFTWSMTIGNLTINVTEDKVPNCLYRVIQEVVLGIKWRKL